MSNDYCFKLDLRVVDPISLYQLAFNRALSVDKMSVDDARDYLLNADRSINVHGCLAMILDPGSLDGCSIYGHEVEQLSDVEFADTEGFGL